MSSAKHRFPKQLQREPDGGSPISLEQSSGVSQALCGGASGSFARVADSGDFGVGDELLDAHATIKVARDRTTTRISSIGRSGYTLRTMSNSTFSP
jgi:hypothetical protein